MRKFLIFLLALSALLTIYRLSRSLLPVFIDTVSPVVALGSTPEPKSTPTRSAIQVTLPTPTVASFFRSDSSDQLSGLVTPTNLGIDTDPSSPQDVVPVTNQVTTTQPLSTSLAYDAAAYREVVIFGDELDKNWSFAESSGVGYLPEDRSHEFQNLDATGSFSSGSAAIAVTPQQDYGMFALSVRSDTTAQYRRDDIVGVSFWLNSGDTFIDPEDLAVTVMQDDSQPFWRTIQTTGSIDDVKEFSETRLYYLNVNRAIPPHTWVNIVVWLDKLIYDPVYTYVTGLYIKNDADIRNTYYVDQVSLLMIGAP